MEKGEKNKKQKRIKNINGITLIALVITIIVLLILAGVSIAMLTGDNGILSQAQRAKNETEQAAQNEISILNSYEDYMNGISGGQWNEVKGVNTPALKENMELVKWNDASKSFVIDDTNSNYDYENQQWANAKVTIDGVESYFVWIPRYEYKITYNTLGTPEDGGTIDVKFIPTSQTEADEGYIIHPVFTNDVDNGGWSSELSGIWVGKYEAARLDANGENEGIDTKIKVQPGVSSFKNETIGNMYTYAKAYSTSLKSHMLKNSEWGAVVYLTESKYGRNGTEVTQNTNSNCITANGDIEVNANQSSTGNVTGIYDLSGGACEYVAAYYKDGISTSLNNGSSFTSTKTSDEYSTVYTGISVNTSYKLGDATYETTGWHGDYSHSLLLDGPFFYRGGHYEALNPGAGVFYYSCSDGGGYSTYGFRIALVVK